MTESKTVQVLDHGFVRLVAVMGDDSSVTEAARTSYGKGTKAKREDDKLIDYLMRNGHTSPFEMVEFKFHIKLPIFIMRQLVRTRTASLNEVSARYSEMKDEFYVPEPESIRGQAKSNKQAGGDALPVLDQGEAVTAIKIVHQEAYRQYRYMIEMGVARELARIVLPVSVYTECYWKIDLNNLLKFLGQRLHPHAQWEMRQYAEAIRGFVEERVPVAWDAYKRHHMDEEVA